MGERLEGRSRGKEKRRSSGRKNLFESRKEEFSRDGAERKG